MFGASLAALATLSISAFSKWKWGFHLVILTAFLQDPLRKLVPGQPPHFILFTGVVFAAAMVGAMHSGVSLRPPYTVGRSNHLRLHFQIFAIIVVLQAAQGLVRTGHPQVAMLGLVGYLAPFLALAFAHAFFATGGSRRIQSFLRFYVICGCVALLTVIVQAMGVTSPLLGEVGIGIRIYDRSVGILNANSGTFRASEIAAWHAATCACVVLLLATHNRVSTQRVVVALVIMCLIIGIGILTGRRKFVAMIAIFIITYIGLIGFAAGRFWSTAFPAALVCFTGFFLMFPGPGSISREMTVLGLEYQSYVARTSSVFGDIPARFVEIGIAPVTWAYHHFGLIGGGAGIGTQGVQHLTGLGAHSGAAEGGLGKIMVELGAFGLLSALSLGLALFSHIARLLRSIWLYSERHSRLGCGLMALLIANIANYSVASQAYGDVFILLFLGICLGALLALPRILPAELDQLWRANWGYQPYAVAPRY